MLQYKKNYFYLLLVPPASTRDKRVVHSILRRATSTRSYTYQYLSAATTCNIVARTRLSFLFLLRFIIILTILTSMFSEDSFLKFDFLHFKLQTQFNKYFYPDIEIISSLHPPVRFFAAIFLLLLDGSIVHKHFHFHNVFIFATHQK